MLGHARVMTNAVCEFPQLVSRVLCETAYVLDEIVVVEYLPHAKRAVVTDAKHMDVRNSVGEIERLLDRCMKVSPDQHCTWTGFAKRACPKLSDGQTDTQTVMLSADAIWSRYNNDIPLPSAIRVSGTASFPTDGMTNKEFPSRAVVSFVSNVRRLYPWVINLVKACAVLCDIHKNGQLAPALDQDLNITADFCDVICREALIDFDTCLDLINDLRQICKKLV
jgi:hypothetical protein